MNKKIIKIDGYDWEFSYIDSTHFTMLMAPSNGGRGWVRHVGEIKGEPYYDEVVAFLQANKTK